MSKIRAKWLEITFQIYEEKLSNLEEFILQNESWLKKEQQKLENTIIEWERENPDAPDQGMDSYNWFEPEILKIGDFKDVFYRSQLLIAFSYLEVTLKKICIDTEPFILSRLRFKDLAGGNYIEQSKLFLDKLLEIEINDLNLKWEVIKDYQKIRNLIAHNHGEINPKSQKDITDMKTILTKYQGASIPNDDRPSLEITDAQFVIKFCQNASDYIKEITKRIQKKLNEENK